MAHVLAATPPLDEVFRTSLLHPVMAPAMLQGSAVLRGKLCLYNIYGK
jgi:hypothetical protein